MRRQPRDQRQRVELRTRGGVGLREQRDQGLRQRRLHRQVGEAEEAGLDDMLDDLKKINDSGKHLLGLINDILDLSKIVWLSPNLSWIFILFLKSSLNIFLRRFEYWICLGMTVIDSNKFKSNLVIILIIISNSAL